MEQYIPKSVLVAEIEKLQLCTMDEHMNFYSAEAQGEYNALSKLESFLDTLEVKEVTIDEEIEKCLKKYNMLAVGKKDFAEIAKHFFELGLKAQKGE